MTAGIEIRPAFPVDDAALSALHDRAFGSPGPVLPWRERLHRHSIARVGAFEDDRLVGFVHAVGDGGLHAFLLDTVVDPAVQRRGVGAALVGRLVDEVRATGCEWLHADFEPHLAAFYEDACGFRPTRAGLLHLAP